MKRASIAKRLLMGALTVSLVMAPAMSVVASTTNNSVEEKVVQIIRTTTNNEVVEIKEVPNTSSVAGVSTQVGGVYLATNVKGTAVTTSMASIAQGYSLKNNEIPYAKFSNMDAKKSHLAMAAINSAVAAKGAVVGPCVNIELGKKSDGKYSLLPSDGAAIRVSLGIPESFQQDGKSYAIVCVRPGGAVTILENISTTPGVLTFDTPGGMGAYAIIKF